MSDEVRSKSARAAGVVGLAVMCSRVLGLIREQVFAWLFGGGREMDAFIVAFKTPNLLRDLFAEGALSTAFVTVFSKKIATQGPGAAWALAAKMATLTAVFMSLVTVVGVLVAPYMIALFAPGFDAEKAALTVTLSRVMFPFILLVSLGALVMGMLNARDVFGVPAMASSFFNIGSIVGGIVLGWLLDPSFGPRALVGLAIGTLLGGAMQLGVQLPSLHKAGFRFRPDFQWNDSGVALILKTMAPAVIAASSVQVNVMVNTWFASWLEDGTAYRLNVAFRLMQLPLGVFGVAIGTVTLPLLSRLAAQKDSPGFRSALAGGMRLAFVLTLPATVGLVALARPIISLLYEHGKFSAHATDQAALALQGYALGLCAYAGLKVLAPAFYAMDRRKTPMVVSFISMGVNVGLNWFLSFHLGWGIQGLSVATGCVAAFNFALLYMLMRKETGLLETAMLGRMLIRLTVPLALLAAVCFGSSRGLMAGWSGWGVPHQAGVLLATIGLGGLAFFFAGHLFRVEEIRLLVGAIGKKLRR